MSPTFKFYDKKNLGIVRTDMPQISSDNIDEFLLHFASKVKVSKLKMSLNLIKPTQCEINEDKVLQMMQDEYDWKSRIYIISADNWLLDGHHGYALGLEIEPEAEVTVYRVNLKIKELLKRTKLLKISTKVDLDDNIVKAEDLAELIDNGCKIVTDVHLEEQLENVFEEYGFEKAIPAHLVKKVVINKKGHSQTVWIDPNKSDGTKFDFNQHPYTGVDAPILGGVEMAVETILKKNLSGFQSGSTLANFKDNSIIEYKTTDGKEHKLQWYKTKHFAKNGVVGIKYNGKIYEKKINNHEIELEYEKEYLEKIEEKRKKGAEIAEKVIQSTKPESGITEFGGFSVGDDVKFYDSGKELTGKIKGIKHHEKYDKFGTALIQTEDGKTYSRSLKKVEKSLSQAMEGNQNAKKDNVKDPFDATNFTTVKHLGGTNGATLVKHNETGELYVTKNLNKEQANNEFVANKLYNSFGLKAPESHLSHNGKLYSKYIPDTVDLGDYLKTATIMDKGKIYKQIKEGFAVDALLANWDVAGLTLDNIVVDPKTKTVYRIDNGGALFYRAQGAPKGEEFTEQVLELQTLKDPKKNPNTAQFFKSLTQQEVAEQIKKVLENKDEYIKQADLVGGDNGLKMIKRLSYLETMYNSEIKTEAKEEGYHKNGLYKKTGVPEIDELYERIDEFMAITEEDKKFMSNNNFYKSFESSAKAQYNGFKDGYVANATGNAKDALEWYQKALDVGCEPIEILAIQKHTGSGHQHYNEILANISNSLLGNINPSNLTLAGTFKPQATPDGLMHTLSHPKDTYWDVMFGAAKTINHHYDDKAYNLDKINALKQANTNLKEAKTQIKKNPNQFSDADKAMVQYYLDMSDSLIKSHIAQKKSSLVTQFIATHEMKDQHNAMIFEKTNKKEEPKKKEEPIKFKSKIDEFEGHNERMNFIKIKHLVSGMAKLEKGGKHSYGGDIYRKFYVSGENLKTVLHQHAEGTNVIWQRSNSASKNSATWEGNMKFSFTKNHGVDVEAISSFHHEQEVLLKPFTAIKVIKSVQNHSNNYSFIVEQIG